LGNKAKREEDKAAQVEVAIAKIAATANNKAAQAKLESEIAENKGKLESGVAVLFAGTNAEDFETGLRKN